MFKFQSFTETMITMSLNLQIAGKSSLMPQMYGTNGKM